jgi:hypothetical protein
VLGRWTTPSGTRISGAAGWTVKDIATHLPDLLNILVTALQGELDTGLGIEPLNDEPTSTRPRPRQTVQ